MVFRSKGARTWKLKLALETRDAEPRTLSTGTPDKATALEVARMVKRMKTRRQWEPLETVFDGAMTLAELFDADCRGTVAERVQSARDVDLDPLVAEWAKRANAKYVAQVRAFIAEGARFPASRFRRKAISEFLTGLPCADPTRNRYRAALSVFAMWLVEREVLEFNPVKLVGMFKENDPRMVWMTWPQAKLVAEAAPQPYRTLFILMAATGIELGVALRLRKEDVDFAARTIAARGSKTTWRNRVVRFEEWAADEIRAHVEWLGNGALLFPFADGDTALDEFRSAQKAADLSGHRLHDLRHTYAVNALRKGYKPAVVAHQLGHKDSTMVTRVYGRFVPDATDYAIPEKVTNPVTSPKKSREVKRAK